MKLKMKIKKDIEILSHFLKLLTQNLSKRKALIKKYSENLENISRNITMKIKICLFFKEIKFFGKNFIQRIYYLP
jgi:hypothetical protein